MANLARTARLAAADGAALDALATHALTDALTGSGALPVTALAEMPAAIRTRVLRLFALGTGVPAGALASAHIDALDALVVAWHGQGAVALPGDRHIGRSDGLLTAW